MNNDRLRFFTIIPALLLALATPAFSQDSKPAESGGDAAAQTALGKELLKAGRKEEAAAAFRKAWEIDGTVESGLAWARALLSDERYNDTLSALDTISDKYKKNLDVFLFYAEAIEARAAARAREGADRATVAAEYEAAARSIEDALTLKPGDPTLLAQNIRYLLFAGKYDEALEVAENARKNSPQSWEVALWHGDAVYYNFAAAGLVKLKDSADEETKKDRAQKITTILASYGDAVKLAGDKAEPHQRIGAFLLATGGDKQKAISEYVHALGLDPSKVDLSTATAEGVLSPKEAVDFFTKAIAEYRKFHTKTSDSDPGDAILHWYMGRYRFITDDRKGSAESYKTVVKKTPSDMSAHYWLGRIAYFEQKYKEAIPEFEIIAKRSPKELAALGASDDAFYPMMQRLVGTLLVGDSNAGAVTGLANSPALQTAILFTKAILENDPKNVTEWNNLGLFNRDGGNPKEALYCYKKALDITPTDPRLLNDTAVIYHYYLPQTPEGDKEAKDLYQRSIDRAKALLEDKKAGAADKENAKSALQDATTNLKRLERGERRNN